MKRLVVMRHAKSSWSSGAHSDHARPLNKRGRRDAPRVGAMLVRAGWQPQLIISSDSQRTRETVAGLNEAFDDPVDAQFWRDLYLSGVKEVVSFVSQAPEQLSTVLVLGHNPGWEHVVHYLTGREVVMKTATAALVQISPMPWDEAVRSAGLWRLEQVIYPRELAAET